MPNPGWLKSAVIQTTKPKNSIIGLLKKKIGGVVKGRDRSQLHASDITKTDFCPRQWAINDLQGVQSKTEYLSLALATTFDLGLATARLLIEWAGDSIIGNWKCRICENQRTMCSKPGGMCFGLTEHIWEYEEVVMESPEYGFTGSLDAIFDVGVPWWLVVEIKILSHNDFEKIVAPSSEHRIRTSLYLKLIAESKSVYKEKFNLNEAVVFYVSRGYGKANPDWPTPSQPKGEILPFKEYVVKRDDEVLKEPLQKAKALKIFRETKQMPNGICSTPFDRPKCDVCKECFSGKYPAKVDWKLL